MASVYFLYSFVLTIGLIITLPWWLLQMLRLGKYRAGLPERLGMVPARLRLSSDAPEAALPVAWIHAVSVGEALAVELVRAFIGASFTNEPRHRRRVDKILAMEARFGAK